MNRSTRKKILSGSIFLSLLMHTLALCFFQRYALLVSSLSNTPPSPPLSRLEKTEKDQILKEAFANAPLATQAAHRPKKQQAVETLAAQPLPPLPIEEKISQPFQSPFPEEQLLASNTVLPRFALPLTEPFDLLPFLPQTISAPTPSPEKKKEYRPREIASTPALSLPTPPIAASTHQTLSLAAPLATAPLAEHPLPKKPLSPPSTPQLPKLPTLSQLNTVSYSDEFEADLVFLPKEEGEGYIFALTLIPHPDLHLPRLQQHFTFLIDKSNSIQQDRLTATKNAIHQALNELHEKDTFNIISFDSKVEKLSPLPLPVTSKTRAQAETFLESIHLGSFFSSSDLYKPLFLTVPSSVSPAEIHTAILLTDGESLAKKTMQRSLFTEWTFYNSGRVSLFTIGLDADPHLSTLDAAAVLNKGKHIASSSKRGLKRKLLKLIRSIHRPVAKNLNCKAISRSPQTRIKLYPTAIQANHLYLDQPYVIFGETATLDDFIIFIQGQLADQWLNVKKTVSFLNGKKGTKSLKAQWALQRAYGQYEQYLLDDNPEHIAEAKLLLQPHDLKAAFQ